MMTFVGTGDGQSDCALSAPSNTRATQTLPNSRSAAATRVPRHRGRRGRPTAIVREWAPTGSSQAVAARWVWRAIRRSPPSSCGSSESKTVSNVTLDGQDLPEVGETRWHLGAAGVHGHPQVTCFCLWATGLEPGQSARNPLLGSYEGGRVPHGTLRGVHRNPLELLHAPRGTTVAKLSRYAPYGFWSLAFCCSPAASL